MIEMLQIQKSFEKANVINKLTCSISEGSVYGLIGINGSGKSTLFRMIMGIYQLEGGTIKIDGVEIKDNENLKQRMVFVPDDLFFFAGYNAQSMANYYASLYPLFDYEKFYYLCSTLMIDRKKQIHNFSKGMKRKVAIILALSTGADYYFFDETFDGLDPVARMNVKRAIYEEVEKKKATVIVSSHNLRELEDICDQVGLLHDGGILLHSDLNSLKNEMFKIQIAFKRPLKETKYPFTVMDVKQNGSVFTYIVRGDGDEILSYFNSKKPLLLDVLPLTLEEVFIHEMGVHGYDRKEINILP